MNTFVGRKIAGGTFANEQYECQYPWPEDCFVQCGGNGLVLSGSLEESFDDPVTAVGQILEVTEQPAGSYRTAFFEAFPRNPNTFIRGEGKTVQEAETAAWEKHQKHAVCDHPEFEKRGYTNGLGFCVKCGMSSSRQFAPWEKCPICDYPIYPDETECYHCHLFSVDHEEDYGDGSLKRFIEEERSAALWLIQQPINCPDCNMSIFDMRIVSSSDYRLTEDERGKQHRLYDACIRKALEGTTGFARPNKRITFPASVFYECDCDKLKLITDLIQPIQEETTE